MNNALPTLEGLGAPPTSRTDERIMDRIEVGRSTPESFRIRFEQLTDALRHINRSLNGCHIDWA